MEAFNALKQADEVRTFPNIDMPTPLFKPNNTRARYTEKVPIFIAHYLTDYFDLLGFRINTFIFTAQEFVLQQLNGTKESHCHVAWPAEN